MHKRSSSYEYSFIKRDHVLFTSIVTLGAALLFLLPGFPFPVGFLGACIASSIFHLVLYFLFDRLTPVGFTAANVLNLFMLAVSVHYTGGILSPFTMVFALVLISGAGYGVSMTISLGTTVGIYCGVIIAEKYGVLPPVAITASDIYTSWPATLLVVTSVVAFMVSSGSIYKVTVNRLRQKIAHELELNQTITSRLAKLDAPSQVGLLVHKIAHDVSGPMGAIVGLLQLLKENESLAPEIKEDFSLALQELSRVERLVNRMVHYVKPGDSERQPLNLGELLETVLSVASFLPSAAGVKLLRATPTGAVHVFASKQELQQVFFNVLKNAMEAIAGSHVDGVIQTTVSMNGKLAVVTVSDNGPGFPKHILQELGRETVTTKPQGSGIGLLIVREIIEAHGGHVSFQNGQGGGAEITTTLPIHEFSSREIPRYENTSRI